MHAQYGNSPLLVAAQNGHLEVVRTLLNGGADVNEARQERGCCMPNAVLATS